jgi:hypothetical protein
VAWEQVMSQVAGLVEYQCFVALENATEGEGGPDVPALCSGAGQQQFSALVSRANNPGG